MCFLQKVFGLFYSRCVFYRCVFYSRCVFSTEGVFSTVDVFFTEGVFSTVGVFFTNLCVRFFLSSLRSFFFFFLVIIITRFMVCLIPIVRIGSRRGQRGRGGGGGCLGGGGGGGGGGEYKIHPQNQCTNTYDVQETHVTVGLFNRSFLHYFYFCFPMKWRDQRIKPSANE